MVFPSERRPKRTMHDWNHDGKIDLLDGFIQDEIESRNTGNRNTSNGSGGGCITILLVPIIILFLYALVMNAPSGVFSFIFFLCVVAVLIGKLVS